MLKKRIKKYICVLSAVIIAFSCFSVSAVETPEFTDNIFLEDLSGYAYYDVFDEDNNLVDTFYIIPDSVDFNEEKDLLYIDFFSSSVPLKKGYKVVLYCSFETYGYKTPGFILLHYADGLKYSSSSGCFVIPDNPPGSNSFDFTFSNYKNSSYKQLNGNAKYYSFQVGLDVTKNSDSLSLVFEFAEHVTDIEKYISHSNAAPRKYKFFSDIGIFFKSAVEWMSDIFDKFVENPAILVLVIGFVIVGFCFGILRKLIYES